MVLVNYSSICSYLVLPSMSESMYPVAVCLRHNKNDARDFRHYKIYDYKRTC